MNAAFWSLFGDDYSENCLKWRHEKKPVLPPSGDSWQSVWTANPDLLSFEDRLLLYYRGHGSLDRREGLHDRIGVSQVLEFDSGGPILEPLNRGVPVVDVGSDGEFDGVDVLDPATIFFQNQVFLYFSAIGSGPDSIGLAVSSDGVKFEKVGKVLTGRAPDVVEIDGEVAMIYQRADENGNYRVYCAASSDGIHFKDRVAEPVLTPQTQSWDSLSLATVRLSREGETSFALYGGSSYLTDEPDFFGLARSRDLISWEFHPGNPIFGCGAKGSPDGGAIWFPALHQKGDEFVMLYEGSRGKYSWDLSSAICMATISPGS